MLNTVKSLVAKSWKNNKADLEPGKHFFDEEFVVRVSGSVEKLPDELAAPTVSVPLIPALALFWEKSGIARDAALAMLREALQEAMQKGVKEGPNIQSRMKDVEAAMKAIRQELIAELPPMKRAGKVLLNDLNVEVLPVVVEEELLVA
jgi:hypothetical protein